MRRWLVVLAAAGLSYQAATASPPAAPRSKTLETVRHAGTLRCGIIEEDAEYSTEDDHGSRGSFDEDLCKAVAVAAIGSSAGVETVTFLDSSSAMEALRADKVDVIPTISADLTHATNPGIQLSAPVFYDGAGFLVPRSAQISKPQELSGHKVCFLGETNIETALRSWFAEQHLDFVPFPFQEEGEMEAAFASGNCTALAGDVTRLVDARAEFGSAASRYMLLPELVSKDPLAPATRTDDPVWSNIVTWVIQCLLSADELGISTQQATASSALRKQMQDPSTARLLGYTHELGSPLGLTDDWPLCVLTAVGSYGQIYQRAFGPASSHPLQRGLNRPWNQGGLLYALPLK